MSQKGNQWFWWKNSNSVSWKISTILVVVSFFFWVSCALYDYFSSWTLLLRRHFGLEAGIFSNLTIDWIWLFRASGVSQFLPYLRFNKDYMNYFIIWIPKMPKSDVRPGKFVVGCSNLRWFPWSYGLLVLMLI